MEFEIWEEAAYRSADLDALETRRDSIIAELGNAESKVATADLEAEAERCMDAINRVNKAAQLRAANIAAVAGGAGHIIDSSKREAAKPVEQNPTDTPEYRKAFMDYVQRGIPMPAGMNYRSDPDTGTIIETPTVTTGVPPQVPLTMQREIVSKMEEYGTIWNAVRKLSVQGGIWFRVLDLNPTATWLMKGSGKTELSVSDYQGVTNDAKISFAFYELECRMAQSLLAQAVTYDDFQAMFVPAVAKAMVKALEAAIIGGSGSGEPLGIINETRITNKVEMTVAQMADWKNWHSMVDAAILPEYDNGTFYMAKATWNKVIDTLADDENAPIAQTWYDPVAKKRVNTLMGKPVELVSTDILPDAAGEAIADGDVFCIYGDLNDYVVNTQPKMPLSTVRWIDHETNTEKIKALMAVDGKVLDPYGFMLISLDGDSQ